MSFRSKSTFEGGPTYMSNAQMGSYLNDLRTNRVARPNGSRPLPGSSGVRSPTSADPGITAPTRMSTSTNGSAGHRPSGDPEGASGDVEQDARNKEKLEARSLRLAMDAMDQDVEGRRVYSAAAEEADALVRKHQNPAAPYRISTAPKGQAQPLDNTYNSKSEHTSSGEIGGPTASDDAPQLKKQSSYSHMANYWNNSGLANPRRSSGSGRSTSGKHKGVFANPEDEIYVDPEERSVPAGPRKEEHRRKEPPVAAKSPVQGWNRPSQTSPTYTYISPNPITGDAKAAEGPGNGKGSVSESGEGVQRFEDATGGQDVDTEDIRYKNGMEVRNDGIRAATSRSMKDRSPRLPSPTVVSDSPGRPIVSFKPDWTPPEHEGTGMSSSNPASQGPSPVLRRVRADGTVEPMKSSYSQPVPTIRPPEPVEPQQKREQTANPKAYTEYSKRPRTSGNDGAALPSPQISVSAAPPAASTSRPNTSSSNVPSINFSEAPAIVVDAPAASPNRTHSLDNGQKKTSAARPAALAKSPTKPRPQPIHSVTDSVVPRSQTSASVRQNTALCAQCALPIAGKIVSAAGVRFHPSCFTCFHCGEGLECVDFYPEPTAKRLARIDRIQRRWDGEDIPDSEGETALDDGDDSLRFYCHLDFHEFFSPRCKSCKTPIEGEVIVACGAEWHVGHFFCAQCGDPFDPSTPFVEKEGYAWCVPCHTNRYSAKCKRCRRPVTDLVVKALGAEWHDECFCCTICQSPFADGRYFLRGGSQDPVCFACEERRLKA